MATKRAKPLYEMIDPRTGPVTRSVRPSAGNVAPPPPRVEAPPEEGWLSPGRAVRVPVGYALVAGAVCVALIVGAFVLGYIVRTKEFERERLAEVENGTATRSGIADPIAGADLNQGLLGAKPEPIRTNPAPKLIEPKPTANAPARVPTAATPVVSGMVSGMTLVEGEVANPLEPGLNYFVVASILGKDDAVAAAKFLAENGVATVVMPSRFSSGSWMVTTRQGFAGGEHNGPEASALKAKIEQVGRVYQQDHRGPTNFRGAYAWKYQ
ncbi:MAG: hypothetical protein KDA20_03380 [Phycisphaerales bacterium]|nr:hypothetical protein [Phycisphaerales bacterium]